MHLSLCDQVAEFVNLCPLGQNRKNEALITKRSMAFSNGQLTSIIKMRSCLLFLVKNFYLSARQAGTSGDKKLSFLRLNLIFFGGEGSSRKYIETYPALNLVWLLIAGRIWIFTGKQLRQLKKRIAVRTLLATKS